MAYSSPYTKASTLHSVQEEDEDAPPPPPPPYPYFFVFPEQIFGGLPYYTSGTHSQSSGSSGSTIRDASYRRSWGPGPDRYFNEFGNGNSVMRTRHHSADDLDGQGGFTQYENSGNNSVMQGQDNNGWAYFKVFLLLLAFLFVFLAVTLFALQLQSYCESSANLDNVPNLQGGKAYCTCECDDLLELFTFRSFYQTQEQLKAMMQSKMRRQD